MKIKVWGARGSLPAPLVPQEVEARFRKLLTLFVESTNARAEDVDPFLTGIGRGELGGFGGNTPCVEVVGKTGSIIIDGGSGIRLAGYQLMKGPCGKGKGQAHLLLSHFHWDHLIGLPFFTPIFIPGNEIHVYAVQPELPQIFETVFKKPYFPLNFSQLGAKVHFHKLELRKAININGVEVTPYQMDHPDPCFGFRCKSEGKVFSYCLDTEAKRVSREALGPDLPLYQNVDLMIFDAQYTLMEALEKVDWGHATASLGLEIAMREGVKKVLFMHHDPASTEEKILAAEAEARRYFEKNSQSAVAPVDWSFGYEGMVIEI